jgi:hypothetical protein
MQFIQGGELFVGPILGTRSETLLVAVHERNEANPILCYPSS